MNPILYAIPLFLLSIALEYLIGRWHRRTIYDLADAVTSLQLGVLSQVCGVFLVLFNVGIYTVVFQHFAIASWSETSWWSWLLALLLYDFLYYWVHRSGHEVNLMWAAHQVHHSSEYFNLSTALRQSSTTALWAWPFYLPMAVLGVSPLMFVTVALIDLLYQYWVHTELIGKLGWFDRVFVSPSNHRVHHGQNDYCIDKNYGGILIIWDRLFGSFVDERDNEKIHYGVRKPLASYNPVWANFNVYSALWQTMKQRPDWRSKLALWLASPGSGESALTALDTSTIKCYDCTATPNRQIYVGLHYLGLVVLIVHFLWLAGRLSLPLLTPYALLIVVITFCLSALLQQRAYARQFEQTRLLLMIGLLYTGNWFSTPLHWTLHTFVVILLAVSWGWLSRDARSARV